MSSVVAPSPSPRRSRKVAGSTWLGVMVVLALGLSTAWALPHPMAPWALQWSDMALGRSSPHAAVARYELVAERHGSPLVREEAHRRAALVHATQLRDPASARRHLEAVLARTPSGERSALHIAIGELLLEEGLAEGAASRFDAASRETSDPIAAGRLLLRAARVLADDRRDRASDTYFRRVARDVPALVGEAELGRGELKLRKGRVEQALTLFERSAEHTFDPDVAAVARLGRTTCLERLGDLDSALAELEQVELLPEEIIEERAGQLRSRRFRP